MTNLEAAKLAFKHGKHFVKKNLPMIMSIGAGIGCAATVVLAIKEAPKAAAKIEEKTKIDPDLTKGQKAAITIEQMHGTFMAFIITEGLLVASTGGWMKKVAGLGALYSAAIADKETKDKVLKAAEKAIGKEKMAELKKDLGIKEPVTAYDAETMAKNPETIEGKNEIRPCQMALTGQVFHNSYNGLSAALEYYKRLINTKQYSDNDPGYDYYCLNDILIKLKCPQCDIGDNIGYKKGDDFSHHIAAEVINGKLGWKVYLWPDPKDGFDS